MNFNASPDETDSFPLPPTVPSSSAASAAPARAEPYERQTPPPVLVMRQRLARRSPQPDRLVAVKAARVPLIEAARPLLEALATINLPGKLDDALPDDLGRALVEEVHLFQSVAQDARLRWEYIVITSYVLCTALDEAASLSKWGLAHEEAGRMWGGRLSDECHSDNKGGESVFLLLGFLVRDPHEYAALLELMLMVMALGFHGMYRRMNKGPSTLDDIRHQIYTMVYRDRQGTPLPSQRAVERLLRGYRVDEILTTMTLEEMFA